MKDRKSIVKAEFSNTESMEQARHKLLRLPISPQSVHSFRGHSDCRKFGIVERNRSLYMATMYGLFGVVLGLSVVLLNTLNLDGNSIPLTTESYLTTIIGSILIFSIPLSSVAAFLGRKSVYHELVFAPKTPGVRQSFYLLCIEANDHELESIEWILRDSDALNAREIDLEEQVELGMRNS